MITKIQNTPISYANRDLKNNNASFKGIETLVAGAVPAISALRFLDNSPAIGACVVDLGSMVIPRTVVDTKNRGVDSGVETGIREGSSTVNHAIVGLVGAGAASAVTSAVRINSKYSGVEAQKIFANNDAIDVFADFWKKSGNNPTKYYEAVLESIEGLDASTWKKFLPTDGEDSISKLAEKLAGSNELTKDLKQELLNKIVKNTGARGKFKLAAGADGKQVSESLDILLENMTVLGKNFAAKGVDNLDNFVKDLKGVKKYSALLGLGISTVIGCSIQPINKYLTKKRTGKEGFVGVEGREPDKSAKFKLQKAGMAALMGLLAFSTITTKPSEFIGKLQFTSKIPNLNQFKLLYGMTIMSRFLSARDKNELRESSIKDFLGFANWLILGGIVSKGVARILPGGKDLINYTESGKTGIKKAFDWIGKASIKNYDEVLLKTASKVVDENGKALGFSKLMKLADSATKAKVGKLALAQIAGYLYSGVVLGMGIAKLNIFITNKVEKGNKKVAKEPATVSPNVKYFAQNSDMKNAVFSKIQG